MPQARSCDGATSCSREGGKQVREITNEMAPEPFRWTAEGLLAMQEVRHCAYVDTQRELLYRHLCMTAGHGGLHRAPV